MRAAQEAQIAADQERSAQEREQARIVREEAIRAAEIERDRTLREAEIAKERRLEVAEQERQIVVNQKSEEESRARASADAARAEAVKAQESVTTVKEVAEAERNKSIALINAARAAEEEATRIRLSAQAEKEAAADRAEAVREGARADADALTIRAEAKKQEMLAEAEGKRAIIEAENALSPDLVGMKVDLARLEAFPEILAQAVKPAEKIDSIRIHQVTGLGGFGGGASGTDKPAVNQALDSVMGMALQMPALRKLGDELGLSMGEGLAGLTGAALNGAPTGRRANGVPPDEDRDPGQASSDV